jgi:hypothetical protein
MTCKDVLKTTTAGKINFRDKVKSGNVNANCSSQIVIIVCVKVLIMDVSYHNKFL